MTEKSLCNECHSPSIVDGICMTCGMSEKFLFNDRQLFFDGERERDNILWRVKAGTKIWPVYYDGRAPTFNTQLNFENLNRCMVDDDLGIVRYLVHTPKHLDRDYILHDDNLHQIQVSHDRIFSNRNMRSALISSGIVRYDDIKYYGIDKSVGFFDSMYAYEFPTPFPHPNGWTVGFLIHFEHVIADGVYMEEDNDE